MSNDLTQKGNSEIKEAYAAKDVAQSLRRYLVNGDQAEEAKLISQLNAHPSFWGQIFPTAGQKISRQVNAEALQQIRKNKSEIMAAHHAMYLESVKLQANAVIKGLGLHLQEQLAVYANEKIENIVSTIRSSQKSMTKKFRNDEREAEEEYANDPKYLEMSIKQIDKAAAVYMEGMEELLDGTVTALKNKAAGGI